MIAAVKSEFRKLLTVRSTYAVLGISLALIILLAFYIEGIKHSLASSQNPAELSNMIINSVQTVGSIVVIASILLMTHEYRYNTIMYTLTSSNSRTKTLFAKFVVISLFSLAAAVFFGAISPLLTYAGVHFFKGLDFVPQHFEWWSIIWRSLFYGWGFGMIGLVLGALLRNQIAAIAAIFMFPSTIEPLMGLILKDNVVYLPFGSLFAVAAKSPISYTHAALVFSAYMVCSWIIAWVLFLKRDAN